jgi:hypothetical protein
VIPLIPAESHLDLSKEIALLGKAHHMSHFPGPSMRDPDGFFPEERAGRPDPIGMWMIQRSSALADRVQSFWWSRFGNKPSPSRDQHGTLPAAELVNEPGQ